MFWFGLEGSKSNTRRCRYRAARAPKDWPTIPLNVVQVVSYKVGGLKAEIVSLDSKTLD